MMYIKYKGGEIIKKYPFVKQRGIKDCAPACVQMILKYYNGYVSLDKLSEMMNTNQNGTTAYNIKETLNDLGFKSYGIKSNNLLNIQLPCIAHVIINSSYKHYIVIYKVNERKSTLLIADPALGFRKISFKEFKKIWSGVTIQMYPKRQIVHETEPKIIKFLLPYIKRHIKSIMVIYILSILVGLLALCSSLFLPFITLSNNKNNYINILIMFTFIFVLRSCFNYLKNKLLIKFNLVLDKELSMDIFQKILNLPYRYYRRKTTGEITSYFNDLYIIRNTINQFFNIVFIEIPIIIIISIVLYFSNFYILIITLISSLSILIINIIHSKKQKVWISETFRNKAICNSYIVESIMGFETIKSLNIHDKVYCKFKHKYNRFIKNNKKTLGNEQKNELLQNLITNLNEILIVLIIINSNFTNLNHLFIQFILSSFLISSFKNIINNEYQFNEIKSAISTITEFTTSKSENLKLVQANGNIIIQNLNYSFDKTNYILKNINLIIPSSSKVMITGSSGSGKSTLFKIIKGYYKDYEGSVKIGDYEISNCHFNNIAYVSQSEILFTGTLEDNLIDKNLNSIKICEIDNFVKKNSLSLIEENGFNLSSGQKQRIILARALKNFQILIIDEGLSQVSVDMERRILKKIFKTFPNKTIIFISHRLDNLDLFELYIKLQKGQIVLNTKRNN